MSQIPDAPDFYLDSISRATLEHYSKGRVALLGDAAYGNALGGFGTGLALIGAYVLAGVLAQAHGEYQTAFTAYETNIRDYATISQKVNAGRLLAPATRLGIYARNLLFSALTLIGTLMKIMDKPATNITLKDYSSVTARI